MHDQNILLFFIAAFAFLAILALMGWKAAQARCATTQKDLVYERETSERWYQRCVEHATARAEAETENAALRSQINQRGAGGKFVKRNP